MVSFVERGGGRGDEQQRPKHLIDFAMNAFYSTRNPNVRQAFLGCDCILSIDDNAAWVCTDKWQEGKTLYVSGGFMYDLGRVRLDDGFLDTMRGFGKVIGLVSAGNRRKAEVAALQPMVEKDGYSEYTRPDGMVVRVFKTGDSSIVNYDGLPNITTQHFKKPDSPHGELKRPGEFSDGVYRVDQDPVKKMTVMEVSHAAGPKIRVFADRNMSGKAVGYKIVGETPHPTGQSLTRYILVDGKMISDLNVEDIIGMKEHELELVQAGSTVLGQTLMAQGRFKEAIDVVEAMTIPSMDKLSQMRQGRFPPFREATKKIIREVESSGREMPAEVDNVLLQRDLGSASKVLNQRLGPGDLVQLMSILSLFGFKKEVQSPEIMALQLEALKKFSRLYGVL
ncbi:MAG: hypothetical protein KKD39_01500 [Candidatus Altiarchaeota archaeon]|nr:hypothetical protein [Candidatus Altiarchaeota archaeon]